MLFSIVIESVILCLDAVRGTSQFCSTSPTMVNGGKAMFVYKMDFGSVRNMICGLSGTSRWLLICLVLCCGASTMSNSLIYGVSKSACLVESEDVEV